jgi:MFS family permease
MLEISTLALVAALFAVTLAVIPLFTEKGMTYGLAAWALGLLGAGQIIGRLLFVAIPRAVASWVPLAVTAGLSTLSLVFLALVPGPPWALVTLAVAAGAVRGAQTLVQASAVVDRWGAQSYGTINGFFAAPVTVIMALAPAIGPIVAQVSGSYATMALIAAAVAGLATVTARFT